MIGSLTSQSPSFEGVAPRCKKDAEKFKYVKNIVINIINIINALLSEKLIHPNTYNLIWVHLSYFVLSNSVMPLILMMKIFSSKYHSLNKQKINWKKKLSLIVEVLVGRLEPFPIDYKGVSSECLGSRLQKKFWKIFDVFRICFNFLCIVGTLGNI